MEQWTTEQLLTTIDALSPTPLSNLQEAIIRLSWDKKTYAEIAQITGYDHDYVRDVGFQLWRCLSQQLSIKVSKSNFASVIRRHHTQPVPAPAPLSQRLIDWGAAADLSNFFGREQDLATLQQWIIEEQCHLITILGMGGIGKSTLTLHLAQTLQNHFDHLIWRSIKTEPPFKDLLTNLLQQLAQSPLDLTKPDDDTQLISRLIEHLKHQRCLIILDNFDALFQIGENCGVLKPTAASYGQLLHQLGSVQHKSCILVTSREKPQAMDELDGDFLPVRSLFLHGLDLESSRQLLSLKGITGTEQAQTQLIKFYRGHPLALKIIATTIRELFAGNISAFIQQGLGVFKGLSTLLTQQLSRLSHLELEILYWLAIENEPVTLEDLAENILPKPPLTAVLEALDSLKRRSLIETTALTEFGEVKATFRAANGQVNAQPLNAFNPSNSNESHSFIHPGEGNTPPVNRTYAYLLQPVLSEYLINKLTQILPHEIIVDSPQYLLSHALVKAQSESNIRQIQTRLILAPIVAQLISHYGSVPALIKQLQVLLQTLSNLPRHHVGYGAGNLINLLRYLNADLTGYQFTQLPIRQAILQDLALHHTNFAGVQFHDCLFANTFGGILCIDFSPDGQLCATSDTNGVITLWTLAGMKPTTQLRGHSSWAWAVLFHPQQPLLASCGDDRTIRLWDTTTGQCYSIIHGHSSVVLDLDFNPDGTVLVSTSNDTHLKLWDVKTGECIRDITNNDKCAHCVVFAPDGQGIYSGGEDNTIRYWPLKPSECSQVFAGHQHWIIDVAITPTGDYLASASLDGTIRLWDAATGECLQTLSDHRSACVSVAFSPDGQWLASGSYDRTVRIWDHASGTCLKILNGHTNLVWAVIFHPSGQLLASGGEDYTTRFWQAQTGESISTLQGYSNAVYKIARHPHLALLASGHEDQQVRLWHLSSPALPPSERVTPHRSLRGHQGRVTAVAFSPDGTRLASASIDQTIRLWSPITDECLLTLPGHQSWIWDIAFHPHKPVIASASYDKTIKLWDIESGQCLQSLDCGEKSPNRIAYSPDGQWLVSGGYKQSLKLWDAESGQCLHEWLVHANRIYAVVFSADSRWLASGGEDNQILLWDLCTMSASQILKGHQQTILSLSFSHDPGRLFSSSADHTIKEWELETGDCIHTYAGHQDWVESIVLSTDGTLYSGSKDGTIKGWCISNHQLCDKLEIPRPYDHMNITGAEGLTDGQIKALLALGAVDTDQKV